MRTDGKPTAGAVDWAIAAAALLLVSAVGPIARADDVEGGCRLSERTCASEGLVIIAPGADRLVRWQDDEINFRRVDQRLFPLRLLDDLGSEHSVTLVLGREELSSGALDSVIARIHARRGAVIVTGPTHEDAARLNQLLGVSGAALDPFDGPARLYGVREAVDDDGRRHPTAFVLFADPSAQRHRLDQSETAWLLERIGRHPPALGRHDDLAAPAATACDFHPADCLLDHAGATHTSTKKSANGDTVEIDNYTYGARLFGSMLDYYYVEQEVQYAACASSSFAFGFYQNEPQTAVQSTIQPSPRGTVNDAPTITATVDFAAEGQTGFQTGPSTFGVLPRLALSHATNSDLPPNTSFAQDPPTGWAFGTTNRGSQLALNTSLIWDVAFSTYGSDQDPFVFDTVGLFASDCNPAGVSVMLTSHVGQPFPATTVELPMVTGVSPSTVRVGQTFTITGTGFFPALIENVLVGGTPLPRANWTLNSSSEITVTAPPCDALCNLDLAVEVDTAAGRSNSDHNVRISPS